MRISSIKTTFALGALALALPLAAAPGAGAAVGSERTDGPNYDRTPSVVQDGAMTDLFFVRSQQPCDRLAGCNADTFTEYDLYLKQSTNGGKDYGPAQQIAVNPDGPGDHRGRTIAATPKPGGGVYVFWASGANSQQLFYVEVNGNTPAGPPQPVTGLNTSTIMNVEAITRGGQVLLYTEEPGGVFAYDFAGGAASAGNLVSAGKNLPKAIVDRENGSVRITYVDASAYPQVDVYVNTSADGHTFTDEQLVIAEPGTSHWDPVLAQRHNGKYELFSAPDRLDGKQQVSNSMSNDFERWSKPHDITPGFKGGTDYWDYWPEPFVLGNKLTLYYTSERATNTTATGTGHIWTDPGQAGKG
jgi:hypothetical protein